MTKIIDKLNRRNFLKTVAVGTCGATCHNVLRPFGGLAYAATNVPGFTKNFIEIFMYGGCCTYGMAPVHNAGAQGKYPTLYRTPAQAAAIRSDESRISLHSGFAPLITEANRTKNSVALVMSTGHPTMYSRSHDIAQQANQRVDYDSRLENGLGVGAAIAASTNDPLSLISFGGNSDFSIGGPISGRSVGSLQNGKANFGGSEAYALTEGMIRAAAPQPATDAQYVISGAVDSLNTSLATLQQISQLRPPANFPNTGIGNNLADATRLIMAQVGAVFFIPYGGFDTHSNQGAQHNQLFGSLGASLAQLVIALKAIPGREAPSAWDETVILFRTDFGRTWENNAFGTDHGHAYHQIIIGGRVQGGVLGDVPTDANYQNATQDYMASNWVQFNAMQPTKEIVQSMGLNVSSWPAYAGNRFSPIGVVA